MARPSKPVAVIEAEGVSHRTKAELESRKNAEESLLSNKELFERPEVVNNDIAHAEFQRVAELMRAIGKDDALYSSGINTYCLVYSEISELNEQKAMLDETMEMLKSSFERLEDDPAGAPSADQIIQFEKSFTRLVSQRLSLCTTIDKKRKMMLDLDKEYCMTLSAALRSIPKQPEKTQSALVKVLFGNDDDDEEE